MPRKLKKRSTFKRRGLGGGRPDTARAVRKRLLTSKQMTKPGYVK